MVNTSTLAQRVGLTPLVKGIFDLLGGNRSFLREIERLKKERDEVKKYIEDHIGIIPGKMVRDGYLDKLFMRYNNSEKSRLYLFAQGELQREYDEIWNNLGFLLKNGYLRFRSGK